MHGVMERTQRHSLPQPVRMKKRDRSILRSRSFWFTPQQRTRAELESAPGGSSDASQILVDPDVSSLRGDSWRHSAQSVTSNGGGSITGSPSRFNSWRSSDRLSLKSNMSLSSVFTRFSGSTASTSLTVPASGTSSKRSSRGSVLQREKRFSNVKCESSRAARCQIQVLNCGSTSDG